MLTSLALAFVASWRRWSPPLWSTLIAAATLRIIVAIAAHAHTPHDVSSYFHSTATLVSRGRDPLTTLPRYQWNFLPVMPYIWALLLHLRLAWEVTDKIPTISADCVNVALVAALAPHAKERRAFQYALNPVAILVTSWHGQVEPVALAIGLGGLLLLRRRRDFTGGLLIGLAAAAKTWPIIFGVSLVTKRPMTSRVRALLGMTVMPAAFFFTMPLLLHDHLRRDLKILTGYRSLVGQWGWAGIWHIYDPNVVGYARGASRAQHVASIGLVLVLPVVVWLWRRAAPEVLVLAVLYVFLVLTAGFGVQYLMWPLPLAVAYATARTWAYVVTSFAYVAVFYLGTAQDASLARLSLFVIVGIAVAMPYEARQVRGNDQDGLEMATDKAARTE